MATYEILNAARNSGGTGRERKRDKGAAREVYHGDAGRICGAFSDVHRGDAGRICAAFSDVRRGLRSAALADIFSWTPEWIRAEEEEKEEELLWRTR